MKEEYLKFNKTFQDAFVGAAENCRVDALADLLSYPDVNIDGVDSRFGRTALTAASSAGSKKTVEFLLKNGADLNKACNIEMTPLMHACHKGKKKGSEVALLLLKHGADAKYIRESDGMSAIKFAYWGQCTPEVFEQLIGAGATPPESDFRNIRLV